MNIRRAKADDMEEILALTCRVFEGEQEIPRSLNPIPAERCPQWWCAEEDGALLGCVALFREDGGWHMGRFALLPACRGRHLGTALLRAALSEVFQQDIPAVSMEARDTTVHILKKFGARVTGDPFPFYRGMVTPMCLTREDFLRAVQPAAQV